jgi:hypothetical protein
MSGSQSTRGPEAVRFKRSAGEALYYGGFAFAAFSALGAMVSGLTGIFFFSGAAILLALHYRPMMNAHEAPLIFEDRGIIIAGLGLVPWDAIKSAQSTMTHVRSMSNTHLKIETNRPLKDVVRRQTNANPIRALQTRVWTREGDSRVAIKMNALSAKASDLADRIGERIG